MEVEGGDVVLAGTVTDPTAKHHAGYEALLVHGVRNVSNRLAVVFQDVTVVPEEVRIKQTVENVLSWHPDLSAKDIRVDLSAVIVTLSGTVPSCLQREKAVEHAGQVDGVLEVHNQLVVQEPTCRGDSKNDR